MTRAARRGRRRAWRARGSRQSAAGRSRVRVAPSARRTAISPRRDTPRTSTSPAMFAQAISSTSRPIALSTISVGSMNRSARRPATARTARPAAAPRHRSTGRSRASVAQSASALRGGVRERRARPQVALRIEERGAAIGEDVRRCGLLAAEVEAELRRHHHRDEHFDVVADDRAVERRVGDADDGQRVVVDLDRLADDVRDRRRSRAATDRR